MKFDTAVVISILVVLLCIGAVAYAGTFEQPIQFYRTQNIPGCANPIAYTLSSSWANPSHSGLRVWACE